MNSPCNWYPWLPNRIISDDHLNSIIPTFHIEKKQSSSSGTKVNPEQIRQLSKYNAMRGIFFSQLPRLATTTFRGRSVSITKYSNTVRCFASSPTSPRDVSMNESTIPNATTQTKIQEPTSSSQPAEAVTPQIITEIPDNAVPSTIDQITSDATDTVTTVAETAATASSFSDTLLQPAIGLLSSVHDFSALPWWLSIAASTLLIRSALLPFTLMTMRNSARMGALKQDIEEKRENVMEAVKTGNRVLAQERQKDMQKFMSNAGVAPAKILIGPLAQFPVFISLFVGIRRLSQSNPDFTTGGAAWFSDLSIMDPTYALPVICGATLLGMTEIGGDTGQQKLTPQMRNVMRGVAVLSIPMTYWFPAAVFCYWIPNNIFSIFLGTAVRTNSAKKMLGLDIHPAQIEGTRAWKEKMAKIATTGQKAGLVQPVDTAAAVASYAKTAPLGHSTSTVKPVLLKVRPSKNKKIKAVTDP